MVRGRVGGDKCSSDCFFCVACHLLSDRYLSTVHCCPRRRENIVLLILSSSATFEDWFCGRRGALWGSKTCGLQADGTFYCALNVLPSRRAGLATCPHLARQASAMQDAEQEWKRDSGDPGLRPQSGMGARARVQA